MSSHLWEMLGNFAATAVDENETWVTDSEFFITGGKAHPRGANGSTFAPLRHQFLLRSANDVELFGIHLNGESKRPLTVKRLRCKARLNNEEEKNKPHELYSRSDWHWTSEK